MDIVATLLVRDEEDIVAANLDHHIRQGIKRFIVTNHRSTDGTLEIIKNHPNVVKVINETEEAYNQAKWVTRMAHLAADLNPHWIVHLDADEFWTGFDVLESVPSHLKVIKSSTDLDPKKGTGEQCREYKPFLNYSDFKDFDANRYPCYTTSQHRPMKGCKIIHRPSKTIQIMQGNHDVLNNEGPQGFTTEIQIDHYPIRSFGHFLRKVKNGGEAYAKSDLDRRIGFHWRDWYKHYQSGGLYNEYCRLAIREPIPCPSKNIRKLTSWKKYF